LYRQQTIGELLTAQNILSTAQVSRISNNIMKKRCILLGMLYVRLCNRVVIWCKSRKQPWSIWVRAFA